MKVRLGGRGSQLSLAQLEIVRRALARRFEVEIVTFTTTGDRLSGVDGVVTGKDLFTREVDEALRDRRIDLGVHSAKDLPSQLPGGLAIAAVPLREDPSDVVVSRDGGRLLALPAGSRIGTSSPRRRAQVLSARPDLEVVPARGNVDTRIRRLREGRWDAIIVARAGLARLNRLDEATEVLAPTDVLPAIGQGALAVVCRKGDLHLSELAAAIDHPASHRELLAERAVLEPLEAGCRAPVAGLAQTENEKIHLRAAVFSPDGSHILHEEAEGPSDRPEDLGREVARRLLARGAAELIAAARAPGES